MCVFWQPLTIHLKSVGLKKFLVAIGVTGIVAHVGRCHLGDVQRAVISKVLPDREKVNKREREREKGTLNNLENMLVVLLLQCSSDG